MAAPPLGNIFNYFQSQGTYDYSQPHGPDDAWAPTRMPLTANGDPNIQKLIDSGVISYTPGGAQPYNKGPEESGSPSFDQSMVDVDVSKLPKTVFGNDISYVRQGDSSGSFGAFKVKNPSLVRNDPNYGNITPKSNLIDPSSQHDIYDMIGPLVMTAVLGAAGAGAFGAVGAGQGGVLSGARAVLGGLHSGNPAGSAGSILGGLLGSGSGIPFGSALGSTLGGMAGNALTGGGGGGGGSGGYNQPTPQQMQQIQNMTPQQKQLLVQLLTQKYGR